MMKYEFKYQSISTSLKPNKFSTSWKDFKSSRPIYFISNNEAEIFAQRMANILETEVRMNKYGSKRGRYYLPTK